MRPSGIGGPAALNWMPSAFPPRRPLDEFFWHTGTTVAGGGNTLKNKRRVLYLALLTALLLFASTPSLGTQAQQQGDQGQSDTSKPKKTAKKKADAATADSSKKSPDSNSTSAKSTKSNKKTASGNQPSAAAVSGTIPKNGTTATKSATKKPATSKRGTSSADAAPAPAATPAGRTPAAAAATPAATPAASRTAASTPAAAAPAIPASAPPTSSTSSAQQAPPANSAGMVWVNTDSGIYHKPGTRWYGKTKQGKYMTEADAVKAGYKAAQK